MYKRAQARRIDLHFTRQLTEAAPAEWKEEIDQTLIPGGIFKEFAFFHRSSKSLILTDTIINIELDKIDQPWRFATWLSGMYYPSGQVFFGMRLPHLLQRNRTKAAFARIRSWRPERVVLSHGRCSARMRGKPSTAFWANQWMGFTLQQLPLTALP